MAKGLEALEDFVTLKGKKNQSGEEVQGGESQDERQKLMGLISELNEMTNVFIGRLASMIEVNFLMHKTVLEFLQEKIGINARECTEKLQFNVQMYMIQNRLLDDNALGIEKAEEAADMDIVTVKMKCIVNDEDILGDAEQVTIVIGQKKFPEELEKSIIGKKVGETAEIILDYDDKTPVELLRNKKVCYKMEILEIKRIKNISK